MILLANLKAIFTVSLWSLIYSKKKRVRKKNDSDQKSPSLWRFSQNCPLGWTHYFSTDLGQAAVKASGTALSIPYSSTSWLSSLFLHYIGYFLRVRKFLVPLSVSNSWIYNRCFGFEFCSVTAVPNPLWYKAVLLLEISQLLKKCTHCLSNTL